MWSRIAPRAGFNQVGAVWGPRSGCGGFSIRFDLGSWEGLPTRNFPSFLLLLALMYTGMYASLLHTHTPKHAPLPPTPLPPSAGYFVMLTRTSPTRAR